MVQEDIIDSLFSWESRFLLAESSAEEGWWAFSRQRGCQLVLNEKELFPRVSSRRYFLMVSIKTWLVPRDSRNLNLIHFACQMFSTSFLSESVL